MIKDLPFFAFCFWLLRKIFPYTCECKKTYPRRCKNHLGFRNLSESDLKFDCVIIAAFFYKRAPETEMQDVFPLTSNRGIIRWGSAQHKSWFWVIFSIKYSKHLALAKETLNWNGSFPTLINYKILSVLYLKFLLLAQFCWLGKLKIFSVLATNI